MKRIITILMMFSLVGCTNSSGNSPVEEKTVAKVDSTKEYIYVESNDGLDIKEILKEANFEDLMSFFDSIDSKVLVNEKIKINIDSEDARDLEKALDQEFTKTQKLREKAAKEIKEDGKRAVAWANYYIDNFEVTEHAISLRVISRGYVFGSDVGVNQHLNYVLNIKDGKLLSDSEVATLVGTSIDSIKGVIKADFEKEPIEEYGEMFQRLLVDDVSSVDQEDLTKLYYRLAPANALFITDKGLDVGLGRYLGLNSDFTHPEVYHVSWSAIGK